MDLTDKSNLENMCRTCLNTEPIMKELFSDETYGSTIPDMIMSFTSVLIKKNDGLPNKVCGSCAFRIRKLFFFKSQCEAIDKQLRNFVQNSNSNIKIKYEEEMELGDEDINDRKFKSTSSSKNYVSMSNIHFNNVDNKSKKSYSIANREALKLNSHSKYNKIVNRSSSSVNKKNNLISVNAFGCRKCDLHFLSWNELEEHNSDHNQLQLPSNLTCRYCNKIFLHQRNIKSHIMQVHGDLKRFQCGYCGECWKDFQNLKIHLIRHYSENNLSCTTKISKNDLNSISNNFYKSKENKNYNVKSISKIPCHSCPQNFVDVESLQQHIMQEHSVEVKKKNKMTLNETKKPTYACNICGKCFKTNSYLKRHEITHDPDKSYHCKIGRCPWSFANEHELLVHINVNHSGDTHQCNFCHKEFKHARNLRQHMALHKLTKRFVCENCHKGFNYLHNLKNHEKTHTGDLPYLCQECGHSFATKYRLACHIKRHSNNRPFTCEMCDKKYISNGDLNAHKKRTHTSDHPFMCSICGKFFRTQYYLTKHIKTSHNNEHEYSSDSNLEVSQNHEHNILSCNICKFQAKTRQELDRHMKKHTCQYFCPYCVRSFSLASALETHIKIHGDENRSHVCTICETAFKRADHLRSHINRKHNAPSRLFKCSCCVRSFISISDLKKHSYTHKQQKPFKCKECGRCFSQSGALKIHSRIHTDERPYICGVCHCSYRTAGSLTSHMRTHTTIMSSSTSQLSNFVKDSLLKVVKVISPNSDNYQQNLVTGVKQIDNE